MQKWDYKTLIRERSVKGPRTTDVYVEANNWNRRIEDQLQGLGNDGWELVAVVPRSSLAGTHGAGFTSEELWVFKRPRT